MLVGIVPAAGHATRLGQLAQSKETVVVRGRPVMDFLLERMTAAGVDELRVVTRPAKEDVTAHASGLGARVVHGHPRDVAESLRLGAEGLAESDEVLFGFPDTLWEPMEGFARLLGPLREGADVVLGLFRTPDAARSDVVILGEAGRVRRIDVKPPEPESDLIWGCAATRAGVIRRLEPGEEPGVRFSAMAAAGDVRGIWLSGDWLDIGTPEALRRAG
jgi:NDP-sugar pyrophosphorylase family protein